MINNDLKKSVREYWNVSSCGTEVTNKARFSQEYFEEIEAFRYKIEPEIFSFAQFTRFNNKKVLEVGVGAGSDFLQWVRAGADAYGIDLTQEAIDNVNHRLSLYGLNAKELKVADAENLPYPDNFFDCVYSWGVIHHSPDTERCLSEIVRVVKPGGNIKIMIYNRRSLFAYYRWLLQALMKGKPFQSICTVLFNYQESPGTKAYTFREVRNMLKKHSVTALDIKAIVTSHDLLYYKPKWMQLCVKTLASILGWNRAGWFMTLDLKKTNLF